MAAPGTMAHGMKSSAAVPTAKKAAKVGAGRQAVKKSAYPRTITFKRPLSKQRGKRGL